MTSTRWPRVRHARFHASLRAWPQWQMTSRARARTVPPGVLGRITTREGTAITGPIAIFGAPTAATVIPADSLLYDIAATPPVSPAAPALPADVRAAETLEFRGQDYPAAIREYERLLPTASATLRPFVLHRLARTYARAGKRDAAIN